MIEKETENATEAETEIVEKIDTAKILLEERPQDLIRIGDRRPEVTAVIDMRRNTNVPSIEKKKNTTRKTEDEKNPGQNLQNPKGPEEPLDKRKVSVKNLKKFLFSTEFWTPTIRQRAGSLWRLKMLRCHQSS